MNVDLSKFSLLWPDEDSRAAHMSGKDAPAIDMFVLEELGLDEILHLKSRDLCEFFTADPSVIAHRIDVFEDMMTFPELSTTLNRLIPILTDIMELRRLEADQGDSDSYLESLTEIELYISAVSTLHSGQV